MQQGEMHRGPEGPVLAPWWKTRGGIVLRGFLIPVTPGWFPRPGGPASAVRSARDMTRDIK